MFKIGEFARIALVSIRLLRYYDKIGLFSPAEIDPHSGYRYYTAQQLPRLHRILALKGLGLSLEQVQTLLQEDIGTLQLRQMLTQRKAEIEQALRDELTALHDVELRLASIEHEDVIAPDIVTRSIPDASIISMQESFERTALFSKRFYEVALSPSCLALNGTLTVVLHEQNYVQEYVGQIEIGVVVPPLPADAAAVAMTTTGIPMRHRPLPGHDTVLTLVQVSPRLKLVNYDAIALWMSRNGFRLAGEIREVYRHLDVHRWSEAVIELQVPVVASASMLPS